VLIPAAIAARFRIGKIKYCTRNVNPVFAPQSANSSCNVCFGVARSVRRSGPSKDCSDKHYFVVV
jgi:hypothetical protein